MRIKIDTNVKDIMREIQAFERDIPFILKEAANDVAFAALKEIKREVEQKLHIEKRPIPNAWRVRKATKTRRYAEIYVDDGSWQYKVLAHHYFGGDRARKGLEKALIYWGYMDRSDILTPSPGVKVKPGVVQKIMAQLKLHYKAGYFANETKKSRARKKERVRYFLVPKGRGHHLHPGIYARMDGLDAPVCIFRIAKKPNYPKRLDAGAKVKSVAEKMYRKALADAVERAWRYRMAKGW